MNLVCLVNVHPDEARRALTEYGIKFSTNEFDPGVLLTASHSQATRLINARSRKTVILFCSRQDSRRFSDHSVLGSVPNKSVNIYDYKARGVLAAEIRDAVLSKKDSQTAHRAPPREHLLFRLDNTFAAAFQSYLYSVDKDDRERTKLALLASMKKPSSLERATASLEKLKSPTAITLATRFREDLPSLLEKARSESSTTDYDVLFLRRSLAL